MNVVSTESALEREGAHAASRGRGWQSNPYLRREQMPCATGETLTVWAGKHDAWQRGFERGCAAGRATASSVAPAGPKGPR